MKIDGVRINFFLDGINYLGFIKRNRFVLFINCVVDGMG